MSQETEENIEETEAAKGNRGSIEETEAAKPQIAVAEHKKPKKYPYFTKSFVLAAVISATGFLQYGYNFWILHFPAEILMNFSNYTESSRRPYQSQQLVLLLYLLSISLYPLGGIVGCIIFAPIADTCGRKQTLMVNNCFTMICALLLGFSRMVDVYEFKMFSHLLTGLTSGIASCIVPVYLSEIAPKDWRGAINALASFFFIFGILVGQFLTSPQLLGNDQGWPLLMSFAGFVAIFQIFLLFTIPESPRYLLIQKRKEQKARQVLIHLKGLDDVEEELEDLVLEDHAERSEKNMTIRKLVHFPSLRRRFVIIVILMFAQQYAGHSAVYHYVDGVFLTTGLRWGNLQVLHGASFACLILIIMVLILLIDSVGRRIVLLIGFGICCFCSAILPITIHFQKTHSWVSSINIVVIVIFLHGHFIGPGSVPPILTSELFFQSSRCSGVAASGIIFWLCRFLAMMILGGVQAVLQAYAFFLYWPIGIATFLFIYKFVPETKKKTFREIRKLLAKQETNKIFVK